MGLLGDIGGMVGGILGASKEDKFTGKAMEAQQNAIQAMLAMQQSGMGFSEEYFQKALAQLNAVGPAMKQELLAHGKQSAANVTAGSLGSGLTGTTAHSGFLRGVTADTQRNLSGLEQNLAGQRSGLYLSRGNQLYQEMIDRANIRQRTKYDPFLANYQPGQATAAGASSGAGIGGLLEKTKFGGFLEGIFDLF